MKKRFLILFALVGLYVLPALAQQTTFTETALADTFLDQNGKEITFGEILEANHGKTVLIDVWATWCKDCIQGMPKVKKLMKAYPDVVFVFLSLDKAQDKWHSGISKYELGNGQHFFVPKGWKSPMFDTIDLDWIPRYMLVDGSGQIKVFKAIEADDKNLVKQLKNEQI